MSKQVEGIRRMLLILDRLKPAGKFVPKTELINYINGKMTERYGYSPISSRTLERDIQDIGELFSIYISYNRTKQGYYIKEDYSAYEERICELLMNFDLLNAIDRNTNISSYFLVIQSCSANSLPLSVVIVFRAFPLYGSSSLQTTFANGFAFFPCLSFSMSRKLVLRSTSVSMALLSLSTIRSISQSPKRFPSASAALSCMLTRFFIFIALVSCLCEGERLYFILCRQWRASSPVSSLRMME